MITFVLLVALIVVANALPAYALLAPPRPRPRHRGTWGTLAAQEARHRERVMAHAQMLRRADLIANGSRADYVLAES